MAAARWVLPQPTLPIITSQPCGSSAYSCAMRYASCTGRETLGRKFSKVLSRRWPRLYLWLRRGQAHLASSLSIHRRANEGQARLRFRLRVQLACHLRTVAPAIGLRNAHGSPAHRRSSTHRHLWPNIFGRQVVVKHIVFPIAEAHISGIIFPIILDIGMIGVIAISLVGRHVPRIWPGRFAWRSWPMSRATLQTRLWKGSASRMRAGLFWAWTWGQPMLRGRVFSQVGGLFRWRVASRPCNRTVPLFGHILLCFVFSLAL